MRLLYVLLSTLCLLSGWSSCSSDDTENAPGCDTAEQTVTLAFGFSLPPDGSRATRELENLIAEEGQVNTLLYAIFQGKDCRIKETADLTGQGYHTGGPKYYVKNLDRAWLNDQTEIFAVANPTEKMKAELMDQTATLETWKNYAYRNDLNAEAAANDSRLIDRPVMAGYLALRNNENAVIDVPVEHVYCRIWYMFYWRNLPEAADITVDRITVEGLQFDTRLFNASANPLDNNPQNSPRDKAEIVNLSSTQYPFLGRLDASPYLPPDYPHEQPQIFMKEEHRRDFNILCRPTWNNGIMLSDTKPVHYYTYSYQWSGTSMEENPLITVEYHFTKTTKPVKKKAKARLFDDSFTPGKRHHGLMRNYTYRLVCQINTVTNIMELQILSQPWYKVHIDDIPPFE